MAEIILTKEIVQLRAEVLELKAMIQTLILGINQEKELREKQQQPQGSCSLLVPVIHKMPSEKDYSTCGLRRKRYPQPPDIPYIPPVPEYTPPFKIAPAAWRCPKKYNPEDLWDADAASISIAPPPKPDPNLPIYKPA